MIKDYDMLMADYTKIEVDHKMIWKRMTNKER